MTPGFASVAAAVLDHTGHPAASIALTYPQDEVDERRRTELAERVIDTAGTLSKRISGGS